jgi:hypothetical protein
LPIFEYVEVYKYVETEDNTQNEGIINWEYSNLAESLSSYSDWMEKGGIMESAFDFYLRDGLELQKTLILEELSANAYYIVDEDGNKLVDQLGNNIII